MDEQSVQLLIRQLVELLDWQSNCLNIGLTVDPTIDPTVEITGQPVSRTQASDASGWLPRYEAKCVQRTRFQWGSVPLRADIKGTELHPANILIPLERQLIALQLCRWQFLANAIARPSVVCLSSVTFVRPTQVVQIFGNFSTALGTLVIRWHPLTRNPAIAEGPRDAGVPVEIW